MCFCTEGNINSRLMFERHESKLDNKLMSKGATTRDEAKPKRKKEGDRGVKKETD